MEIAVGGVSSYVDDESALLSSFKDVAASRCDWHVVVGKQELEGNETYQYESSLSGVL